MIIKFSTKLLVVFTAAFLLAGFTLLAFLHQAKALDAIPLFTKGQPSIGNENAPVHVVVFEDPKCNNCIEEEEYWNYQHRKFFSHVEEEEDY